MTPPWLIKDVSSRVRSLGWSRTRRPIFRSRLTLTESLSYHVSVRNMMSKECSRQRSRISSNLWLRDQTLRRPKESERRGCRAWPWARGRAVRQRRVAKESVERLPELQVETVFLYAYFQIWVHSALRFLSEIYALRAREKLKQYMYVRMYSSTLELKIRT